jgi:hypothetical protein
MNQIQKPLFKIGETGLSDFKNQTLRLCRDGRQSGASSGCDEVLLLQTTCYIGTAITIVPFVYASMRQLNIFLQLVTILRLPGI